MVCNYRPEELDEAVRRRFTKRLYIPLPPVEARLQIVRALLQPFNHSIDEEGMKEVAKMTKGKRERRVPLDRVSTLYQGFSGADMRTLASEASYGPLRDLSPEHFATATVDEVRTFRFSFAMNALFI